MEWIAHDISQLARRADIVSKTTNGRRLACHVELLPATNEADEEVTFEFAVQNLGQEVKVAHESSLQDDRDVASVEKLDWVRIGLSSGAL